MEYRLWIYRCLKKRPKTNKNNIASCYFIYNSNRLYYFLLCVIWCMMRVNHSVRRCVVYVNNITKVEIWSKMSHNYR